MFKGQRIPVTNEVAPNTVLDRGEYHVSYNSSTRDYGSKTTAIVLKGTVFLILNGDHRGALEQISETAGLHGCFDYFLENIHKANHLCSHKEILRGDNTFNTEINARKVLGDENISRLTEACEALAEHRTAAHVNDREKEEDTGPEM